MNDSAKTGLEREINRKLDALKATVEMLAARMSLSPGYSPASAVAIRLKEAWKEEEEVQRGPV